MKQILVSLFLMLIIKISYCQESPEKISESDFTIGKTIKIRSKLLNETRDLNIYLPISLFAR